MTDEVEKEKAVVADTPERTQIATPLSKFEDSPVFNYINSLSPIEPVKTVHITQTFNSLSFASLPSVFTSPHVTSLKESRFLRRYQFSDRSKPEFSSENANNADSSEAIPNNPQNPSKPQKDFGSTSSATEFSVMPSCELTNHGIEVSRTSNNEPVRPDARNVPEMESPSASLVPFNRGGSADGPCRSETEVQGVDATEHNTELSGCEWDSLISNASELLNFDSPSDADPNTFLTSITKDTTQRETSDAIGSTEEHTSENPSGNDENLIAATENQEVAENIDSEAGLNLHRGMRRRCLVFEMVGSRKKQDGSTLGSLNVSVSNGPITTNDKHLVPMRARNDPSRCMLPGIGLHLNALATTSVDQKVVNQETFGHSGATFCTISAGQEFLEKDFGHAQNEAVVAEDASRALDLVVNEELMKSSPRKKRRRESEGCKRCNCKKSKCLKLYCECFAAGVYCVEPCSCQECFNKPIHEDTVLATRKQIESRNPLAFAPKVIRTSDSVLEIRDESSKTPASARHKRGCNCKKSGCLKKYCECFQGGVGCSIDCRCEGCKNTFGRKDGSEVDLEVHNVDESQGNESERSLQISALRNDTEAVSATPATPSCFGRKPIPLAISSRNKPPRSFVAPIGSSSQRVFRKLGNREDEMPDFLQGNGSPIKSSSPNSKRVSPPHSSPGQRTTRKLVLQSIPSFPSLTPKH